MGQAIIDIGFTIRGDMSTIKSLAWAQRGAYGVLQLQTGQHIKVVLIIPCYRDFWNIIWVERVNVLGLGVFPLVCALKRQYSLNTGPKKHRRWVVLTEFIQQLLSYSQIISSPLTSSTWLTAFEVRKGPLVIHEVIFFLRLVDYLKPHTLSFPCIFDPILGPSWLEKLD